MSIQRWNAKTDTVQADIVRDLEKAGVKVWVIKQPCDLLCWVRGVWQPLEVKTPYGKKAPKARKRKDQEKQNAFLAETNTPVVTSFEEALTALGLVPSPSTSAPCTLKHSLAPSASAAGR